MAPSWELGHPGGRNIRGRNTAESDPMEAESKRKHTIRISVLMICLGAMGVQTPEAAARGVDGRGAGTARISLARKRSSPGGRPSPRGFGHELRVLDPGGPGQEVENLVRYWHLDGNGRSIEGPGPTTRTGSADAAGGGQVRRPS